MAPSLALHGSAAAFLVGMGVGGRGSVAPTGGGAGCGGGDAAGPLVGGGTARAVALLVGAAAFTVDPSGCAGRDLFERRRRAGRAHVRQGVPRRGARLLG